MDVLQDVYQGKGTWMEVIDMALIPSDEAPIARFDVLVERDSYHPLRVVFINKRRLQNKASL